MSNRRYTREFSYTRPIMYQGEWYPSADTVVSDGNGVERKGRMFADSNGNYFTLDENGNAMEAMPVENLDEVIIKPSNQEMLANAFNSYLTMSNDKARVGNVPHRKYNTHLTENALSGAKAHAAWDSEHPNLSAWRDAVTAVPFAVAAAPVVGGFGEVALGTAAGQAVRNGVVSLMTNPIVDAANTTLGLGFAGKGAYDVSQGEFTPGTFMDLAGGAGLLGKSARRFFDIPSFGNKANTVTPGPKFVSELDWTPENWFGKRLNGKYDAEDIAALNSHIPEYLQIEEQAKTNGTWLRMPDGSKWEGDPRSWVQLMSKNGNILQKRRLFHGDSNVYTQNDGTDVTPELLGGKILWTSTNKHLPVTYGNNHYELTIPEGTPNTSFDAEGRFWNQLSAPSGYKYKDTNDVSFDLLKDNNTVTINNVVDVGPDPRWKAGSNGLPNGLQGEKMFDYYDRVFKGDDVILGKDVRRKSLLGNNGNFDLSERDIYKGLIPLTLFGLSSKEQ